MEIPFFGLVVELGATEEGKTKVSIGKFINPMAGVIEEKCLFSAAFAILLDLQRDYPDSAPGKLVKELIPKMEEIVGQYTTVDTEETKH